MPTTAEKLWEATRTLPEPLLAEVLDFAEFLRSFCGLRMRRHLRRLNTKACPRWPADWKTHPASPLNL